MYEDEEILAAEEAARRRRVEENEANFARLNSIATSAEVASDTEVAGPRYSADGVAGIAGAMPKDGGAGIPGARPAAGGDGVLPAAGGEVAQPRIIAESNVYEIPATVPNVESSISEAEVDAGIEQDEKRRPLEDFADSGEKRSVVRYYDAEDPRTTWTVNGRDVDKFMSDRTAEGKTVRVDAPVEFEDEGGKTYVAYSSEQGELRTTAAYAGQRLAPVKYFVAPEAITTADGMTYHRGERVRVVAWEGDDQKANDARIKMNELRANGFELVGGRPDDFSVAGEALKSAAAGYYSKRDENAFDTVVRVAGESLKGGSVAMGDFVIGAAKGVVNAGLDVAAMAAGAGMNGALPGGVTGMLNPSLPDPEIARASGDMIREAKAGVNEVAETASRSMREELLDGEYWSQDTEEGRSALSGVSEFFQGAGEIQGLGGVGKVFGHAATSIAMGAMGYQGIYDDPELRQMLDSGDAGQRIKAHLIGAAKGAAMAFGGKIVNRLTEAGLPVAQARKIGAAAFGQMAGNILRGSVEFAGFNDLNILVDVASKGALTEQGNARMAALAEAFRTGSFESPEAREYWQGVLEQAYDETISGLASGAFVGVAGVGAATIKGAAARMKAARAGWQDYVTSTIQRFNAQRNQALEANAQAFADSVASGELAGVIDGKRVGKGAKEGGAWVPTGTETTPGGGVVRTGTDGRTEVVTPGGVVLDGEGATVKTVAAGKTPDHNTRNAVILARSMRSGAAAGETVELANITGELPSVKGDGAGVNGKPAAKVPVVLFRGEDGTLEVVSGRGRVANARALGENAIKAVVLDAKDGWTRDSAQIVDAVENLMDGANMTGAARVAAYERLGVGWEEANAMGLVTGKLAKEAWDVAHSHAQPIHDRVADETIGLGVGAELVRGLTERDTGLRGEELWRLHERASYALANATRADAREFVARVRAEIDSRRARGLEVRADECVDAALETGRADGLRLAAAERGVTEEAAKQVSETVVDDGGRPRTVEDIAGENRGAVERLEENTGEAPREEASDGRAPAWLRATGEDGVFEIPDCPSARVEAKDGKYVISGLELADIDARPDDIVDLVEELSKSGRVEFTSDLVRIKVIDAIEKRMDFETVERLATTAQRVADRMTGGTVRVRVGTEAERRASAEAEGVQLVEGDDGRVKGAWDPERNEVVLFDGADAKTVAHELLMHVTYSWAKANSPELYERLREAADSSPAAIKDAIKRAYGEIGQDALLDEILAGRFERKLGAEFRKLLHEDAEVKTWWEGVWQWVKDAFAEMGTRLGMNDVDLKEVLGKATADEAVEALAKEILDGKRLGKMSAQARAREAVAGGTEVEIGGQRLSLRSMKHDLEEGVMINALVSRGVLGEKEARVFESNLWKLVDKIAQNKFILDMNEDYDIGGRVFNPYKPNSDPLYKISLDFSTLCKKRLMTQYVIEQLQLKKNGALSAEEQIAVRQMLKDFQARESALQVACHLCYVEAARLKAPKQQERFFKDKGGVLKDYYAKNNPEQKKLIQAAQKKLLAKYGLPEDATKKELKAKYGAKAAREWERVSRAVRDKYVPSAREMKEISFANSMKDNRDFLSAENLAKLKKSHPDIYESYTTFVREATHSKSLEDGVPYYFGDSKVLSDKFIKKMNEQGTGLRSQSWSDFQMIHLLDTITAICDLSSLDTPAKMHVYTKVPVFAKCFGKTGVMINLSLIPNADGKGFSSTEGMDYKTAIELRKKYPETCGTIAIAMSFEHLKKLISDPNIDYVIPYHKSGMNKTLRDMSGIGNWHDFESAQHEKEDGRKNTSGVENWQKAPEQSEWLIKDGKRADGVSVMRESQQRYLDLCQERGLLPKFAEVDGLVWFDKKSGKYKADPNYWKLLIDHKMINQRTGKQIQQQAVRPEFDFNDINKEIDLEVAAHDSGLMRRTMKYVEGRIPQLPDMVKELKKTGTVKELLDKAKAVERESKAKAKAQKESLKSAVSDTRLQRGGSDAQRALRAIGIGGTRVVRPNESGERTPGGAAASRARYDWESLPPQQRTNVQTYSFSGSELVRMYKLITGGTLPPHTVGALRGEARQNGGRMGWTTGDRVAVLKDIFGVVDASDADAIKQQLKMMGMFKNEDMAWCVAHTPDQIAQERAESEQMQGERLQKLGEERIEGRTPGGQRAAVNVMAANIGKVLCDLPNDIGGNLGQVRTLGQGILRGFGPNVRSQQDQFYYVQEAANMMNWWHGRNPGDRGYYDATAIASDPRKLRDVLAESFGVFLTSPDTMASMSPGLWRNMLQMIGSSPTLEHAWLAIKTTAQNEGSASRVLREARLAATRQHEIAMQKMADEASKPVGTGWQRLRDATSYNINTVTGPMFLHLERGKLAELGELKKLLRQGRITQADYDAQAKRYEDLIQEVKLGLLTMDRGKANEIRSYLWDQDVLFESARRAGVNMQDWWDYGHLMRVIETGGRAAVRGESPRDARISLDALRARIGDAKFRQIEELAKKFQANREKHLLEDPRLVEAFGQEYIDYLKANVHYVRTERIESPEELARIESARAAWRQAHPGEDDVTTDMLETVKRYARGINSGGADTVSHALEGSLRDSKDWMYATLKNDERIMQFAERNDYVISMRNALVSLKCEGVHDLPYDQAASYRGGRARYGTINYIEAGQKRTLVVPKVIEDGFSSRINDMDGWGMVGRVLHGTMIDYNFAYTPRNITRNLNANEVNLEGMHASRLKTVGRYLAPGIAQHADNAMTMFARHLPEGLVQNPIARVMLGRNTNIFYAREAQRLTDLYFRPDTYLDREAKANAAATRGDLAPAAELAEDLKRLKFVMAGNSLISRWQVTRGDRFLDDFMKSRGLSAGWHDTPNATPVQKILRGAGSMASWPFRANARYNAELEVWTKIVGALQQLDYRQRTGAGRVDAGSVGYATMMGGGIPWYERPSQQCKVINYVCNMYYQTAKNGTLRWAENVHQRPREVLQKMAVESIGPRLFNRIMIAGGGLAYLIWSAFDGDEEKISQSKVGDLYAQLNRFNSWYKGQSEYMKRYYDCIPVAKYGDTVVSLCAPLTDEEKLLLPFVDAMVAKWSPNPVDPTVTWGEAISQSIKGPLIPDVFARSPVFALLQDVAAPLVGVNPWDSYRQKVVYNPDLFARRGESAVDMMDMSLEIVKQALNDVGVGRALNVSRWGIDDGVKGDLPESLETFMRDVPGVSGIVGSMLRCSNEASVQRQAVEEMLEPRLASQRSAAHDAMRAWLASGNFEDGVAVIDKATSRYGWSPAERAAAMRKIFNAHSYAARVTPAAEVWKLRKSARKGGQDVRERIELFLSNSEY